MKYCKSLEKRYCMEYFHGNNDLLRNKEFSEAYCCTKKG